MFLLKKKLSNCFYDSMYFNCHIINYFFYKKHDVMKPRYIYGPSYRFTELTWVRPSDQRYCYMDI
jgi:hypothetical protein